MVAFFYHACFGARRRSNPGSSRIALLPGLADRRDGGSQGGVGIHAHRCSLASMSDGGRVSSAKIVPDNCEAGASVHSGQVHGQVSRLDDRRPTAGSANAESHTKLRGHGSGDRVKRQGRPGQERLLRQDRSNRVRVEGAGLPASTPIPAPSPAFRRVPEPRFEKPAGRSSRRGCGSRRLPPRVARRFRREGSLRDGWPRGAHNGVLRQVRAGRSGPSTPPATD